MMKILWSLFIGFGVGFGSALIYLVEASDSSVIIKLISVAKAVFEQL